MTTPNDETTNDTFGDAPGGATQEPQDGERRRRRRRLFMLGGLGLTAMMGLLSFRAFALGRRRFRHGFAGGSEADMREHLKDHAAFVLDRLDGSDEQQRQIEAIVDEVSPELYRVMQEGRQLHEQAHEALGRQDAAALEATRKHGVQVIDRGSALALDAMQRMLAVLDDEQRAELQRLHGRYGRGHGGGHGHAGAGGWH